jgi:hypothetical protein
MLFEEKHPITVREEAARPYLGITGRVRSLPATGCADVRQARARLKQYFVAELLDAQGEVGVFVHARRPERRVEATALPDGIAAK